MAFNEAASYVMEVQIGDSRQDFSTYEIRLIDADGAAAVAALNFTAFLATEAGQHFLGVSGLSAGTMFKVRLIKEYSDPVAVFPAPNDNVYNFDKINVGYKAGVDRYNVTIPARDDTAYNVGDDGVTIVTTGAGASAATTEYVDNFNTTAKGKNGQPGTVEKMYIQR